MTRDYSRKRVWASSPTGIRYQASGRHPAAGPVSALANEIERVAAAVTRVAQTLHHYRAAQAAAAVEIVDLVRERIEGDRGPEHPWTGNLLELEQSVRRVLVSGRC